MTRITIIRWLTAMALAAVSAVMMAAPRGRIARPPGRPGDPRPWVGDRGSAHGTGPPG
ncbi:MAG: hypothetical protein ACRDNR_12595 [Gaiellaceae bacterium]